MRICVGVLNAKATRTRIAVRCIIHVTRVCRTRSASRLSRPGAGYPRSEGSGANFEVYLGIATAVRALRAVLEYIQTQLRHHSLRVSVEFLAVHWR